MSSEIKSFYFNTNVLITGATGLFGKMLIYKLLSTCDNVNTVYLIVREKKGKNVNERMEEIFQDVIFDKLKAENPKFLKKIHIIPGDCSQLGLGLHATHRNLLIEKINIVFHCAASLSMDAKLKHAVETNVRGLSELIDLCHEMCDLKSMVYVSTAYSNCTQPIIEEKLYKAPIEATTLIKLTEEVDEHILDNMTTGLLGNWPNTYSFTKAIAENACCKNAGNLPVGIFRPSIVLPTYSEPVPGWTSNIYGPIGVMTAAGLGILRVFIADGSKKVDLVPADFCVNALICSAWEIEQQNSMRKSENTDSTTTQHIPVYNYSGGARRNITWNYLLEKGTDYEIPFKDPIWATRLMFATNPIYFRFLCFFLHIVPGYLMDTYLIITGKKARLIKAYTKISKFQEVLTFFTTREWDIINKNIESLWAKLSVSDKKLFPFDMDVVDHKKYILNICKGIKLYVMKENLDNVKAEKERYQRLVFLHHTVKGVFQLIVIMAAYKSIACFYFLLKSVY